MRTLTLLRHAKSSWAEPGIGDQERSLNERGQRQLQALAPWYDEMQAKPDIVLCSPALRTRQTVEAMDLPYGDAELKIVDRLYNGPIDFYLDALWQETDAQHIVLVGHNPTCDELARYLAKPSGPAYEKLMKSHFGTAAMAIFDMELSEWAHLGKASCTLRSFVRPKDIEKGRPV